MGSTKRKFEENPYGEPAQNQRENGSSGADADPVACIHEVSYPEGYVPPSHPSASSASEHLEPPKVFPFTLDPFQVEAIKCLKNGESVMVNFLVHISSDDGDSKRIHGSLQQLSVWTFHLG